MSDLSQGGVTAGGAKPGGGAQSVATAKPPARSADSEEAPLPESHDGGAVVAAQVAEAAGEERDFPVQDRVFHLVPKLPGITLMKMGVAGDPTVGPARQMSAIMDFLSVAIVPDERAEFIHFLEYEADPVIEVEELNDLISKMAEVFTGRPT